MKKKETTQLEKKVEREMSFSEAEKKLMKVKICITNRNRK